MKKWIPVLLAAALLAALFAGCGASGGAETKEGTTVTVQMEDWEKDLLCSFYTSQLQQEKIRRGELFDSQRKLLEQMRGAKAWLEGKYPSHSIAFVSLDLSSGAVPPFLFGFTVDGGETVYLAKELGDSFGENYFASVLLAPCEALLLEKLRENGVPAAAVEVEFLDMAGDAVTERTDAAALLALGDAVSRRTTVYLRGGAEQLAPAKAAAEALAPSGMWWLYAADYPESASAADCRAFNRDKPDAVQSDSFRLGVE